MLRKNQKKVLKKEKLIQDSIIIKLLNQNAFFQIIILLLHLELNLHLKDQKRKKILMI